MSEYDDFESAFEQAASEEPATTEPAAATIEPAQEPAAATTTEPVQEPAAAATTTEPVQEPAAAAATTTEPVQEPAAAAATTTEPAQEPAVATTEPVQEPTQKSDKQLDEERIKALAEEALAKKQAEIDAEAKKASEHEAAVQAAALENPSAEEQKILDTLIEDFPEVSQAFKVIERITTAKLTNAFEKKLSEFSNALEQRLLPVMSVTQTVANNAHEQAILTKHPDAFDIVNNVHGWVDKQPAFLQKTYKTVLAEGSSAEVISLLDIYKETTKSSAQQNIQEPVKKELTPEKQAKLASMEGVKSRQVPSTSAVDPNDFDGAFEKFANVG